jgi:tetratricopeptide (TPR) repeat protein
MKTILLFHSQIIIALIAIAMQPNLQSTNAQQTGRQGVNPVMKISNQQNVTDNPVKISELKIDIKVVGQIAITTLELTYHNYSNRILEGEFNFPLGEGQTVSRFALDIDGKLREGVVVEKEKGRTTFEAIVRRNIDPGLLEKTTGNNFRARVYPLPANGSRKVVIGFEQELIERGEEDLYLLPLTITEAISRFSVHVEVIKQKVTFDKQDNEFNDISFKKWNDSYIADLEEINFVPNKQIAFKFPHISESPLVYTAAKSDNSGASYFYFNLRPQILEKAKILPEKIILYWDNSNSGQFRNTEKEMELLGSYLKKIGRVTVELIPFNISVGKPVIFEITEGNWDALHKALSSMVYDGATSMGSLELGKYKGDEILIFSDGMSTYGNPDPVYANIPVYTINSGTVANHALLNSIAQCSGGATINLNKLTAEEAIAALSKNNYHFISAIANEGHVYELYPSVISQFNHNFSMSGLMTGESADLTLNFGFGTTIAYSVKVNITTGSNEDESLLKRIWAEKKLADLSVNELKNKEEITRLGKECGIVSANTSLIVLDNLEDYLQYKIIPPEEMQTEYYRRIGNQKEETAKKAADHLEYVVNLSNDQSTWWKTNYPLYTKKANVNKDSLSFDMAYSVPVVTDMEESKSIMAEEEMAAPMMMELNNMPPASVVKADIQLNAWDPQTPYFKVLQYTSAGQEYQTYLKLKKEYGSMPAFYIDASDFFAASGNIDTAVLILSNLAELKLEAPQLLRVLGKKFLVLKQYDAAIDVFTKVLDLRGEEPQSYRDLGIAYQMAGKNQLAVETLYEVVNREWDQRFPEIEIIVMNEINNILAAHKELNSRFIDKRLLKNEPVDIRVVLTWDTDDCDMDLWVTDPSGEKCYYGNNLTRMGGKISSDFTGGYGPEEFMIHLAETGEYTVQSNYFGTRSQAVLAPVNLHLVFFTNYGKPDQKQQEVVIRLESQQDIIEVGKFKFASSEQK